MQKQDMFKPKVISLNKKPRQTFGFYLRAEHGEEGHLIRCLEMGGPAELAGMKDGDRILRVNGTFVDGMSHVEVVDVVKRSGASVTFHILDEESYKQAKARGVDLASPHKTPANNGAAQHAPKAKLCYLVKSTEGFGFCLSSFPNQPGIFIKGVIPGGVAENAGLNEKDRLVEINGENIEDLSHIQVVNKIKKINNSLMFLVVDEETDEYYKGKPKKTGAWLATVKHLPHKPRFVKLTKGPNGFGFTLTNSQTEHFIKDVERKSPAENANLKKNDRVVAVDGKEVDGWSHDEVVNLIRKCGNSCCLLVVDKFTDQMYKLGNISPMLYKDASEDCSLPPSYSEALYLPSSARPSTPEPASGKDLEPKLCRMKKSSGSFGFHLNYIEGMDGHFISEVVEDGLADREGMKDGDILLEVNGVNVEKKSHDDVVEMIHRSGNHLEMLVASKIVYDQLKARKVCTPGQLREERPEVPVQSTESDRDEKHREDSRPDTPAEAARERTSSSSSEESLDEKF